MVLDRGALDAALDLDLDLDQSRMAAPRPRTSSLNRF
jgi:hypothetical protein